ncbi:ArsR family transcriptional regulator [Candidatus Bathyarchaeota archaeon]|nr:ArsR family transcriptional regulator [Candidatus Bathyarchaeota archaeon]
MINWKNAKIRILQSLSSGPKTWTEIRKATSLSRPVVSEHLKALLKSEHIELLPSESKRGRRYSITSKGREEVIRAEDAKFSEENLFLKSYDLRADAAIPGSLKLPEPDVYDLEKSEGVPTPEHILSHFHPVFPLSIRALVRLNENGRFSIEPYLDRMKRRYGLYESEEWMYENIVHTMADPMIRKFCEVLVERARQLCFHHYQERTKANVPSFDNILKFNFEFLLRYEGENQIRSATEEDLSAAKDVVAGILLLYLGSEYQGGPIMGFVWREPEILELVKSDVLTKEEVQPLLNACVKLQSEPARLLSVSLRSLSEKDKKELTMCAYKRFYRAGLFRPGKGRPRISWEERLELLPVMEVIKETVERGPMIRVENEEEKLAIVKEQSVIVKKIFGEKTRIDLEELAKRDLYRKPSLKRIDIVAECSCRLGIPTEKAQHLLDRLVELKVLVPMTGNAESYQWNAYSSQWDLQ